MIFIRPRPRSLKGSTYRTETPIGTAFITVNETTDGGTDANFNVTRFGAKIWTKYETAVQLQPGYNGSISVVTNAQDASNIAVVEDNDGKDDNPTANDVDSFFLNFSYSTADSEIQLSSFGSTGMRNARSARSCSTISTRMAGKPQRCQRYPGGGARASSRPRIALTTFCMASMSCTSGSR